MAISPTVPHLAAVSCGFLVGVALIILVLRTYTLQPHRTMMPQGDAD